MAPSSPDSSEPPKRASCDGCFLAKVKCGKEKPICTRCLATGLDCHYSPSARAGKRKPRTVKATPSRTKATLTTEVPEISMAEDLAPPTLLYNTQVSIDTDVKEGPFFDMSSQWPTSPRCVEDRLGRIAFSAGPTPCLSDDSLSESESMGNPTPASYNASFSWSEALHHDLSSHYGPDPRSKSIADMPTQTTWTNGQNNFIPLTEVPQIGLTPTHVYPGSYDPTASPLRPCSCFDECLQALQAIQNHSGASSILTSFDVALTANCRAVELCTAILSCAECLNKSEFSSLMMLIGTIMSKVLSFYRTALQVLFGYQRVNHGPGIPTTNPARAGPVSPMGVASASMNVNGGPFVTQSQPLLPVTFGSYRFAGEDRRWIELEILLRESRKLNDVFHQFKDIYAQRSANAAAVSTPVINLGSHPEEAVVEEMSVHAAITNYLGKSLHMTLEMLSMQRELVLS